MKNKNEFIKTFELFDDNFQTNYNDKIDFDTQINKNEYYKILKNNYESIIKNDFDLCITVTADLINNYDDDCFLPHFLELLNKNELLSFYEKLNDYKLNQFNDYAINKMKNHILSILECKYKIDLDKIA